MPPIDKTPWWITNPMLLEGTDVGTLDIDVDGTPTRATSVAAAIYEKDVCRVAVFCLAYACAEDASAEYSVFNKDPSSERFMGLGPNGDYILMVMLPAEPCPDQEFFIRHFSDVAGRERPQLREGAH